MTSAVGGQTLSRRSYFAEVSGRSRAAGPRRPSGSDGRDPSVMFNGLNEASPLIPFVGLPPDDGYGSAHPCGANPIVGAHAHHFHRAPRVS